MLIAGSALNTATVHSKKVKKYWSVLSKKDNFNFNKDDSNFIQKLIKNEFD